MRNSVKTIYMLLALLLLTVGSGCRRTSHNGDLDGNWRVKAITVTSTGTTEDLGDNYFIAINLELMQLRAPGMSQTQATTVTGVMDYDEDAGRLTVDFPKNDRKGDQNLERFGIYSNPVTFQVSVSSRNLVLKSPESVIECRRF